MSRMQIISYSKSLYRPHADKWYIYWQSYGGYTTSHTLGYDGGETFKCGVAVAPLADWRFYGIYLSFYL